MKKIATSLLVVLFFPTLASAQAYRCTDSAGKVTYQQISCPTGQHETRPLILQEPSLTEEEKFNASAYYLGMTPSEARQRIRDANQSVTQGYIAQTNTENQTQRTADCNSRYDILANDIRRKHENKGQSNLSRRLIQLEHDRSACIYGTITDSTSGIVTIQTSMENQTQRTTDCNSRYDVLANDLRSRYGHEGQSNLSRRLIQLERDRSACIYGTSVGGTSSSNTENQTQRNVDCNSRYDVLANDLRSRHGAKEQGDLSRQLMELERDRSDCIYGTNID